ncbi:MAG TPA: capsular biosynthesis protein, partial [Sulfurovum sp.]|nr:capsular biosynthesis protein [Sulfurovum sp.]
PGYTHDITNTGDSEMVLLLWANETFDREYPDTYFLKV